MKYRDRGQPLLFKKTPRCLTLHRESDYLSQMQRKLTPKSVCQAAETLSISEQRVRKLCMEGSLAAEKVGNAWVIDADSIEDYGLKSGHIIAEDHAAYKVKSEDKPIALSFFSGAMGLDLGVEEAGFDVRLACEVDKFCRQTISLNRPDTALLSDINDYEHNAIRDAAGLNQNEEIDLIVGGPPCQAFSTAGKREGLNDERGNVFLKYIDLSLALKPKVLIIENVRGLLSCPMKHRPHNQRGEGYPSLDLDELKGGALNYIISRLRSHGYNFSFNLYNAANYGTPQIRERVVIVCTQLTESIPYLVPTNSSDSSFGLPKWKTFKNAVKGLKSCNHINFPEKRLKYYRMLEPGQNWRNLPDELQREAMGKSYFSGGGKTGFLRRLAWDKPSPTLVTHPAMPATDLAHPEEDRPLSIEEYKRVQEFPDSWELAGPIVQQYKQVGNAVPKGLGLAMGCLARAIINGEEVEGFPDFPYSRYKNTSSADWLREFQASAHSSNQKELELQL